MRTQAAAEDDGFHQLLAKPETAKPVDEVPTDVLAAAVKRSNAASFALWRAFDKRGNFVVSPYSIRSALGLVYFASLPGKGRSSLRSRLRYPARNEDVNIRLLDRAVRALEDKLGFESASALWVARQHVLSPTFLETASRTLSAEVHSIDFAGDPGRAERTINTWVSDRTRDKIPTILEGGSIHERTRSVLVDAVSLSWAPDPGFPFAKSFSTARGETVKADMMECSICTALFRKDYKVAFAEYRGGRSLVLVVVMPKRWRKFHWNAAAFRRLWAARDWRPADLQLPKLRLRSRKDLGVVLAKLGVDLADSRLHESLLPSGQPVSLDTIVHEAFAQVDATTIYADPLGLTRKLLGRGKRISSFRVDRPFYFLLVERKTGLILLMGQVTDPTARGG